MIQGINRLQTDFAANNGVENIRSANAAEKETQTGGSGLENPAEQGTCDKNHVTEEEKQQRLDRLQALLQRHNVEISYNEEVNRYAIKIIDSDSKNVVKEIPSEKMLDMFARMLDMAGLLVDEKL